MAANPTTPTATLREAFTGAAAVIAVITGILVINDPNKGVGLPITVVVIGLVVTGMGIYLLFVRDPAQRWHLPFAVVAVVLGMLVVIFGAAYWTINNSKKDDPDTNGAGSGTTTSQGGPTTTGPSPSADTAAVALHVVGPDDNLSVTSDWTVKKNPPAGQVRFLVAVVQQDPPTGAAYIDYFPKAQLGRKGTSPTTNTFSLKDADPHSSRKVVVISVPDSCSDEMSLAIPRDAARTGSPCPGQKWAYASKAFDIVKP